MVNPKTIHRSVLQGKHPLTRIVLLLAAILLLLRGEGVWAQVISNNGAAITVTSGAAITTKDFGTTAGSTLNNGTVQLTGNWNNAGSATTGSGIWIFSGNTDQHIANPGNNEYFYNLLIDNSGSGTSVLLDNSLTVGHVLNIDIGKLEVSTASLTVTDSTLIRGTLSDNNSLGTDRFFGNVWIKPGGIWDFSGNDNAEFRGGITFNGLTFNSGTGQYNFTTNNQELNSNSQIPFDADISVNSITLNNKTDVWTKNSSMLTSVTGGKWVNDVNSRLRYDYTGASLIMNGELYASAIGNTVRYGGNGNQKMGQTGDYYNLILNGSGTKSTLNAFNVLHNLTIEDSVTFDMSVLSVRVADTLSLLKGYIDASDGRFTLGQNTSSEGFLNYTSGIVFGPLERWIGQTSDYLFPVGALDDLSNNAALFKFNTLPSAGSVVVEFKNEEPDTLGLPLIDADSTEIDRIYTKGYWSALAQNSLSSTSYDLQLTGNGFITFPIDSGTRMLKRTDGGPWTLDGTHKNATDPLVFRLGMNGIYDLNTGTQYGLGHSHPVIVLQPSDLAVCEGTDASFEVHSAGAVPLSYQWYKDGSPDIKLNNDGHFSGVNTDELFITGTLLADSGTYYCRITDKFGNVNFTRHARLTVNRIPTVSLLQTRDTICNNTATSITPVSNVNGSTFTWTVSADAGVTGATAGNGLTINDVLTNNNAYAAKVVYTISPVGPATTFCEGSPINDTVWVEPTPGISISVSDTVICNETSDTISVVNPNTTLGQWKYDLTIVKDGAITGNTSPQTYTSAVNLTETLSNSDTLAHKITYTFTPRITPGGGGADCGSGVAQSVTIWVNPTPRIRVSAPDTVICNNTSTTINIRNPNTSIQGQWKYDLTISGDAEITGNTPSQTYTSAVNLTETLSNSDTVAHKITYTFTPRITPNDGGADCGNGVARSVTIWVNPTPRIRVSAPDSVICNNTATSINVRNPNASIQGQWKYDLTVSGDAEITGNTLPQTYTSPVNLTETLSNSDTIAHKITYTFTPRITPNDGGADCGSGVAQSVTIWVNPTPRVRISAPDTVICNNASTTITIRNPNNPIRGTWNYNLTVTPDVHVTGAQADAVGSNLLSFTNTLVNDDTIVHKVVYTFKPNIFNDDGTPATSCSSVDTTIIIWVNPTSRIRVSAPDTVICNNTATTINVRNPNTPNRGTWNYNLTVTPDAQITGAQTSAVNSNLMSFTNTLVNDDTIVHKVIYTFKPNIFNDDGTPAASCSSVDTTIIIWVNPTPGIRVSAPDTVICNNTSTTLTIRNPNTPIRGTWNYNLTVTPDAHVTGAQADAAGSNLLSFTNTLVNDDTIVHKVVYYFKPNIFNDDGTPATSCSSVDTTIIIWVNPTPRIRISAPDTVICNNTSATINVRNPNIPIRGTWNYNLTVTPDTHVTGAQADAVGSNLMTFTNTLVNDDTIVHKVVYTFKPNIFNDDGTPATSCSSVDTTIIIWINPTPGIRVSAPDTVICNNTSATITVRNPNTPIRGTWNYNLTVTLDAHVTGAQSSAVNSNLMSFTNTLVNDDTIVHKVVYTFKPNIFNDDGTPATSCSSVDTTIIIWVNPTPRIRVSAPDTVICNNTSATITVRNPNTPIRGTWNYNLTVTSDAQVTGAQANAVNSNLLSFTNTLVNDDTIVHKVVYTFKPNIFNDDGTPATSCSSVDTTIIIWVNPTPRIRVSAPDTVICNNTATTITVRNPNNPIRGTWNYNLTVTPDAHVTGAQASAVNSNLMSFTNTLVNDDTIVHKVIYTFKPNIFNDDGTPAASCSSVDTNIIIWVNPSPRIRVSAPDTVICNNTATTITVRNPNTPIRGTWNYNLTVTPDAHVTGAQASAVGSNLLSFTNTLVNDDTIVHKVVYYFKPNIFNDDGTPATSCSSVDTTIIIWVNPTPGIRVSAPDTVICNNTSANINISNPNTFIQGQWKYDLTISGDAEITGNTLPQTYTSPVNLTETLSNSDTIAHKITYTFTPRITPNDGGADCGSGVAQSVTIWVNPTPRVRVSAPDTVICNNTSATITVRNPNNPIRGTWNYNLTVTPDAHISGAQPSAVNSNLISFTNTLGNDDTIVHKVVYYFKPNIFNDDGSPVTSCNSHDTTIIIWVNPTARIRVSAPDTVICNNTSTTLTIRNPNTPIRGTWNYNLTVTPDTHVTGAQANAVGSNLLSFTNTLVNDDTIVHKVVYTFKPNIFNDDGTPATSCSSVDTTIIIWVNPTPRIRVSAPDTVICNNTSATITVRNPNNPIRGTWNYNLTVTPDAHVTGAQSNAVGSNFMSFTNTLVNDDTIVHKVVYTFKPNIFNDDGTPATSCSSVDTTIIIWVNPTPRIRVSAPDTVICNNTSTTITIRNPNNPIRGTWNYNLTVTPDAHVTGAQADAVGSNLVSFTNTLVNDDTIVHKVVYYFKPNIFNDDGTPATSCSSVDTTIIIWVNPTPRIRVSAPDTVICNNTSATITVRNPNNPIRGTWNYNLTVTPDAHVTGAQASAVNSNLMSFTNTLVNDDTIVHKVIYTFKPNIFNDDGTPATSCSSVDTTIIIWVNPTPRIRVSAPDTVICNNTSTTITVRNPNTPIRGTWNYNLTVTPDAHVTGAQASAVGSNLLSFTNTLVNDDTIAHKVVYYFKPNIFNDDGTPATSCSSVDTTIIIWVNPTPRIRVSAPDTVICNNTSTIINVSNPNASIQGQWKYDLTVSGDAEITGNTLPQTYTSPVSLTETLSNSDTIAHKITYTFAPRITPNDGGADCGSGVAQSVTIWVNPTPRVRVSAPDTVICNNASTTITIRNPNTPIRGTWNYNLTVTPDAHVIGAQANAVGSNLLSFTNTLVNDDTIVHKVVYYFKPNIFNDDGSPVTSCNSHDTTILIWVNPTARIRVSAPDTVICNNTSTTLTVRNPNNPIRGTWNYNLTVTPDAHVTGAQANAVGSNLVSFTNTLINDDTIVHKVVYTFKPNIFNDDGTPATSCSSVDTTIIIWVNPTPRIRVSAPDTVICNNTSATITVRNPNTPIRGTWNYNLTVTPDTHVTGAQASAVNSNLMSFTNTLVNDDTIVHKVVYTFKPNIFNDDGTPATSCNSVDTTIIIWVNPTPRIRVSAPDTVICNNTSATITVRNPNNPIRGTWNYNLTVTPDTHVTGAQADAVGSNLMSFTNTLVNDDTIVHKVVYYFKPNIFNDDGSPVTSCNSHDTTIIIWVNPTPRIRVSAPDTVICNNTSTTLTIRNPNNPIRGTWNYNLTVTPDAHVTGAQSSAVSSNLMSFTNTLVNDDTIVHKVIYTFKPNIFNDDGTPATSCSSVDTTITIWVNPTPRIRVSAPDTVICNNTATTITVRNPNTPIRGTWNYNLTVTPDAHVTGAQVDAVGSNLLSFTNTLVNDDTIVHKVVYTFKPNIFNDDGTPATSCSSVDTTIIIWVNPTPRIRVSAPDTVICNNTSTTINVRNANTPIRGTWNYNLTVTPDAHVTGAQASAVNSNLMSFTNTLVNDDTIVHKVIYTFKPNIFNDDGTPATSCSSVDTTIIIWVNPTPRIRVSAPDTVICNNTSTTITLRNPNNPIRGTWNYNLTVTPDAHISGAQPSAVNSNLMAFTNTLGNDDTIVHKVVYYFKPNIFNDDGTPVTSCNSHDTTIIIWVNPTPRIRVSAPDTVICNNTATTINVRNPNNPIRGTWNYNLTVTPDAHVTGAQANAVGSNLVSFTNTLVNDDTIVHKVVYTFKPNIFNDDGTPATSCSSVDTTIIIWVNPTPRIRVSAPDTVICNNTSTTITIRNPNNPIRGTWNYNLTVTPDAHVTGAQSSAVNSNLMSFTNTLGNDDTIVHKVVYYFKPNIFNDDGSPVTSCNSHDTTIIIWVNPTPRIRVSAPDTVICNNTSTTITVRNPNTPIRGTWNYNLTVTPDAHVTGAQSSAVSSNLMSFTNTLVNDDTIVHKVVYTFKPNIFNDDGTPATSCSSVDTTITIWVNPTPRIRVSAPDTVICNNTATTITVRNPNTPIRGTWNYNLTVTPDAHVTGAQSSAVNSNLMSFTNTLVNDDTIVHKVVYTFKPNIFNDDGTPATSCSSVDTTIIIWVNPTPRIRVSAPDTVICNNTSATITVRNPNNPIRGTWNYNLTVTPDTHVTGAQADAVGSNLVSFTNMLVNDDTIVHKVVYTFKPNIFNDDGTPATSCSSVDTTIIIWVNPTPRIRVSAPDTVICSNTSTTINVRNPNTPIRGTWNYNLTVTPDAHVTGAQSSAVNSNLMAFTNTLVNDDTIVHKVVYYFKPNIFNDDGSPVTSCNSHDTTIIIWVNPTPRIRISAPDTVICNNTSTTITIRNPNNPIRGTWNYNLTVTPDAHVTGAQANAIGSNLMSFANTLVNDDTIVHKVVYTFKPNIFNDDGTPATSCNSVDTTIIIWVNPTPRIRVSATDTIICNNTSTSISLRNPNTPIRGTWNYNLTVTPDAHITGAQPSAVNSNLMAFTNTLGNDDTIVHKVVYYFKPNIFNDDGSPVTSCNSQDTTIVIWVNPTPRLSVNVPDTIICDSTTLTITVNDGNGAVAGQHTKVYELTTTNPGGVLNVQSPGEYPAGQDIINQLINPTNQVQMVTYYFKASIRDDRPGHSGFYCDQGKDTTIRIYVNPTPRIDVTTNDTLFCNNTYYQSGFVVHFSISTPSRATGALQYDLITSATDSITGFEGSRFGNSFFNYTDSFSDTLTNYSDSVKTVIYRFVPFIKDARPGVNCGNGVEKIIRIHVLPTLKSYAISDSTFIGGWEIRCNSWHTGKVSLKLNGGYLRWDPSDTHTLYNWTKPGYSSTSQNISGLDTGTYYVKVTDWKGCWSFDTITLTQPTPMLTRMDVLEPTGCTENVGKLQISPSGSTPGYYITWEKLKNPFYGQEDEQVHSSVIYPIPGGSWYVYVLDTNKCRKDTVKILPRPADITLSLYISRYGDITHGFYNTSCFSSSNGFFSNVIHTGGLGTPTFTWTDAFNNVIQADTIGNIYGLKAGKYTMNITDEGGCTATKSYTLVQPPRITTSSVVSEYYNLDTVNISCYGRSDGTINETVLGGLNNFQYSWSTVNGSGLDTSSKDQAHVSAGTYYLKVTDIVLRDIDKQVFTCNAYDTVSLKQPDTMSLSVQLSNYHGFNVSCTNSNNGTIQVDSLAGGVPPYTYLWSGVPSSGLVPGDMNQNSLYAGNYQVRITYGLNCYQEWSYTLTKPSPLVFTSATDSSNYNDYGIRCHGDSSGFIHPFISGGVPGRYSYTWTAGNGYNIPANDSVLDNLVKGNYSLTVTDSNNCQISRSFSLNEPDSLTTTIQGLDVSCNGFPDGKAILTPGGGVDPYSFIWSNDSITKDLSGLAEGTYYVVVSDQNNCQVRDSVIINTAPPIVFVDSIISQKNGGVNVSCFNSTDGFIKITAEGGSPYPTGAPYDYTWTLLDQNTIISAGSADSLGNLGAGTYKIMISDRANCRDSVQISLKQPDSLIVNKVLVPATCFNSRDGSATLVVSGGTQPYQYIWQTGQTSFRVDTFKVGSYAYTVYDQNNCNVKDTANITQPDPLELNVTIEQNPYCPDSRDGIVDLNPVGGNGGYQYLWMPGNDTISRRTDVMENNYHIILKDVKGCQTDTLLKIRGIRGTCVSIPEAFISKSNGEYGNETWNIRVGSNYDKVSTFYPNAVVTVFDRWGRKVYESPKGYPEDWDGGNLPMGAYYYVIVLNHNKRHPITGTVNIIRLDK